MSNITLNANAGGTGIFTIASPSSNTNRTLTLPDATGTIQVSDTPISGTTGSFSGDLSFNSGYGSAAVAYGCRAWVNFNGTGTVAIRASGNVTSITDNGAGDYTVNFTTAMPDANYSCSGLARIDTSGGADFPIVGIARQNGYLVGSVRINTVFRSSATNTATLQDPDIVALAIFR